jgi:hypothetical protein
MLERMVSLQTNRIAGETHEILLDLLSTLSIHILSLGPQELVGVASVGCAKPGRLALALPIGAQEEWEPEERGGGATTEHDFTIVLSLSRV